MNEIKKISLLEFLEETPLYTKCSVELPDNLDEINLSINKFCPECKEKRTFILGNKYIPQIDYFSLANITRTLKTIEPNCTVFLYYVCGSCGKFNRSFSFFVGQNKEYIQKIGQYPAFDITIKKHLREMLGGYTDFYQRGLICEYNSYGIGAFVYYRRIIEGIIGNLLNSIPELMTGEEKQKYEEVLEKVKNTKQTQEKIKLVKDLLPSILKPEGYNPLMIIFDMLSKGIHNKTDEECLDYSHAIRKSLIFLVEIILRAKKQNKEFTESMKKLLEKRRNI
jgi:hypothetical protein